MLQNKRVLIAPLDWGLGHASRCIPVIDQFCDQGCTVLVAGSGTSLTLLRNEFPNLEYVEITPYKMSYTRYPWLLLLKFPWMVVKVFRAAANEHKEIERIVQENNIELVVADQRFGCHTKKAKTVFISHQLCVKMPVVAKPLEWIVWKFLHFAANRFNYLWVPDFPGSVNLTGYLSRKYPVNHTTRFIGPLSRFTRQNAAIHFDLLVLLSGPEPQRTLFQQMILHQLKAYTGTAIVCLGKPDEGSSFSVNSNVTVLPHADTEKMEQLVSGANAIVCRGGYTTIMELVVMRKPAILVPTPGQTEQEYLCERLSRQGMFVCMKQKEFDVYKALDLLKADTPEMQLPDKTDDLTVAVEEVLSTL